MNWRLCMGANPRAISRRAGYQIGGGPSAGKTSVVQPVKTAGVRFGSKCEELTVSKSRPLCPAKRTSTRRPATSQMGQYATYASQQGASLFDHLVGAGEYGGGHVEPKRLSSFEIEHKPQLGGSLHR